METNYNDNELELMRKQMDILKEKLSNQEIINKRMIREAMRKRMSWVNWMVVIELILSPFLISFLYNVVDGLGYSHWITALLVVILYADIFADYKINHIKSSDWAECELLEIGRRLVKMKRLRTNQAVIGFVAAFVLIMCCIVALACKAPMAHRVDYIGIGTIIVIFWLVIALLICIGIVELMNNSNDRLIREIKKITADMESGSDSEDKGHDTTDN